MIRKLHVGLLADQHIYLSISYFHAYQSVFCRLEDELLALAVADSEAETDRDSEDAGLLVASGSLE